jgi:hypothetical protein
LYSREEEGGREGVRGEERKRGEVEAEGVERVWGGIRAWGRGHGVFKYMENYSSSLLTTIIILQEQVLTLESPSVHPVHSRTQELKLTETQVGADPCQKIIIRINPLKIIGPPNQLGDNVTKLRWARIPHTRGISTFEMWRTGVTVAEIGLAGGGHVFQF